MKINLAVLVSFAFVAAAFAKDDAPDAAMTSVENMVSADIAKQAGDVRGLNDEKDVTGLVFALQQKEIELQAARVEIARLRAWIEKISSASKSEQMKMHYNMGCMYKLYKQFKSAETEFLKALNLAPDDANLHYNLGILYDDDLKDKEAARKHYGRFLELSTDEKDRATVSEWLSSL
jgi:tetratricopeptide (TPR) repeat protein